ncbi:MAG TPA: N-acetyltransferase [Rhizobiaceae bacterium]|nr:N-acetyltransferase [Rhizobiaceae bacterium]
MEITAEKTPAGNASSFMITAEACADVAAREALLDRAMGHGRKRKSSEKLRRGRRPSQGLAFVARDASGAVIGTVRLWDVTFRVPVWEKEERGSRGEGEGAWKSALLLGPLAVAPAHASAGIGSALMRHAIAEAARLGHRAILLVGDAPYYKRFGFSADKTAGLAMPGPYERDRFLALELVQGALDGAHGTLKASGRRVKSGDVRLAA